MKSLRLNNNEWWLRLWKYLAVCQRFSLFSNDSTLCRCGGTVCLVATRCCSIDSIVSDVMKCECGFGKKGLAWNVLALSVNSPLSELVQLFHFRWEIYYWTLEGWSNSLPLLILCYIHKIIMGFLWQWKLSPCERVFFVCVCVFVLQLEARDLSHWSGDTVRAVSLFRSLLSKRLLL